MFKSVRFEPFEEQGTLGFLFSVNEDSFTRNWNVLRFFQELKGRQSMKNIQPDIDSKGERLKLTD